MSILQTFPAEPTRTVFPTAEFHFLNVGVGTCIIIQHDSGRISMIDIYGGNRSREPISTRMLRHALTHPAPVNFRDDPVNPLDFLDAIGVNSIHRFIVSHPECDHLDGLDALTRHYPITNFWHPGVSRAGPDFRGSGFRLEDWRQYEMLRAGNVAGCTTLLTRAGDFFAYANHDVDHDGLYVLSPDARRVAAAMHDGDLNDASYVLLYHTAGGRILIPGDAHDETWSYVISNFGALVRNVSLMIAPHHGRKSDRDYRFLDVVRPKLTFFGYAPSEHLAYAAWRERGLPVITSNRAGCVTAICGHETMNIYAESEPLAHEWNGNSTRNTMGFAHVASLSAEPLQLLTHKWQVRA